MAHENVTFDIKKGPSKSDLMRALSEGRAADPFRVTFMMKATAETEAKRHLSDELRICTRFIPTRILGVVGEQGSDHRWRVNGFLTFDGKEVAFAGTYDSHLRTGHFTATFK